MRYGRAVFGDLSRDLRNVTALFKAEGLPCGDRAFGIFVGDAQAIIGGFGGEQRGVEIHGRLFLIEYQRERIADLGHRSLVDQLERLAIVVGVFFQDPLLHHRATVGENDFIEIRLDGVNLFRLSRNFWRRRCLLGRAWFGLGLAVESAFAGVAAGGAADRSRSALARPSWISWARAVARGVLNRYGVANNTIPISANARSSRCLHGQLFLRLGTGLVNVGFVAHRASLMEPDLRRRREKDGSAPDV